MGKLMTDTPVLFKRDGAIARLTLNRPAMGNAIDLPMASALMEAAVACDLDDSIRCVVLTGAGGMFCVGGDIGGFASAGDAVAALVKDMTDALHMAVSRLARMPKPLVTMINGPAAGAGVSLAILGDIVLATDSAHFTLAYTGIGFTPDVGMTWLLPRLVGLRQAQEMALTNRRVSAAEAATLGLITRAVDGEHLAEEVGKVTTRLAASATRALGRTRNLLRSSFETTFDTQMELEAQAIIDSSTDSEGREGVAAFLAKRKPHFAG
jgi:2-(1,2-epoxy-1,2-dihydrophenyl)acetyl-CoA isomerase